MTWHCATECPQYTRPRTNTLRTHFIEHFKYKIITQTIVEGEKEQKERRIGTRYNP